MASKINTSKAFGIAGTICSAVAIPIAILIDVAVVAAFIPLHAETLGNPEFMDELERGIDELNNSYSW
jgi:hypothetical protein